MNLFADWSYPTAIRFGAGRIQELAEACNAAGIGIAILAASEYHPQTSPTSRVFENP